MSQPKPLTQALIISWRRCRHGANHWCTRCHAETDSVKKLPSGMRPSLRYPPSSHCDWNHVASTHSSIIMQMMFMLGSSPSTSPFFAVGPSTPARPVTSPTDRSTLTPAAASWPCSQCLRLIKAVCSGGASCEAGGPFLCRSEGTGSKQAIVYFAPASGASVGNSTVWIFSR